MKTTLGLSLGHHQKLMATPQLRQALKVLQLNTMELSDFISHELIENPMLEVVDEDTAESAPEPSQPYWSEYFYDADDEVQYESHDYDTDCSWVEHVGSDGPSLKEYVLWQVRLETDDPSVAKAAEWLLEYLDDNGYLDTSIEVICRNTGIPYHTLDQALRLIQAQEPAGIGARSLEECLLLQLDHMNAADSLAAQIIKHHLRSAAAGRLQTIARKLGVGLDEVRESVNLIRSLDPKPGARLSGRATATHVIPEASIERVRSKQGIDLVVVMNDSALPRLRLSKSYMDLLRHSPQLSQTRAFLEERMLRALWLLKNIEHRRSVIYRVLDAITAHQRQFFFEGPPALRPLTQKEIARQLDLHESTVSRAVSGKFVDTPYGTWPIQFFFQSGVGPEHSRIAAKPLRLLIRNIVSSESPANPLSDQEIARRLNDLGIPISRRTVAKYRELERILPSHLRRKHF